MKHIYKSTRVLPYVYMCKEKNGPNFYIGYRFANYVPSTEDFGTHYFTSNEYVRNNFDQFDYYIVAEFYKASKNLDVKRRDILTKWYNSEYRKRNKL